VFDEALARLGLAADIRLEMNSAPMLLAAVRAGIGAAVVAWTSLAAFGGSQGLAFRPIVEPELVLCVSLRASPLAPTSNAAHVLHDILANVAVERVEQRDWQGAERMDAA
jgi:DNA-binding transcriptional LysR family regulator